MNETDEDAYIVGSAVLLAIERMPDFRGLTELITDIRRHDADGWNLIAKAAGIAALEMMDGLNPPSARHP